jgi:DNA-binding transcriptional ArsR family regulator
MPLADDQIYELHAAVCKAIAHAGRLKVLDCLREGEECVCRLAPHVGVTEAHLSQLLAVLRRVGVVESRRDGHQIFYRVRDDRIFEVIDGMRAILGDRLAQAEEVALQLQTSSSDRAR